MPSCSAPGCTNRSEKSKERGITFHNLPVKNSKLAKTWLDQLRRDERFMPKKRENVYVCSEHFTEDCFETNFQFEFVGGTSRKRRLKKGAVPTLFKRKTTVKARITSERRIARKEQKEVIY